MTDKEYAPLTTICVRCLNDKLYEKRKTGALEIEKMVKEFVKDQNDKDIKRVLKILGDDFALSSNPNTRKGGLIGLAAAAIALGKDSSQYVNELVKPVLACFRDQDSRVRYYSCEALYNIVKVTRGSVLPFFNEIFDSLSKLVADPDQNVKNGTVLLDRLIKDIVSESSSFDLVAFIPLLRERIYTQNQCARQFIVSWIETLDAVPDINMLVLLPEILDGLFQILGDPDQEIYKMCESVLKEFLTGIKNSKSTINFAGMANILIVQSQNQDNDAISYTAMSWLEEFVKLAGRSMLPFVAGILTAIAPRLISVDIDTKKRKCVREAAERLNKVLMELINEVDDNPTPATTPSEINTHVREVTVTKKGEVTLDTKVAKTDIEAVERTNQVYKITSYDVPAGSLLLDVRSVITVLCDIMRRHKEFQPRIASLKWFRHLLSKVPNKTFRYMPQVFPVLMATLADIDQSDEAVLLALEALAKITSYQEDIGGLESAGNAEKSGSASEKSKEEMDFVVNPNIKLSSVYSANKYFVQFMVQFIEMFKKDRSILDQRGSFMIRQLCLLLSPEDIFQSLSEILVLELDAKFACTFVQSLNTILLTSAELFELRNQLKDLNCKESCRLFECLYRSWSHSPVATLALCYLSQNYSHACQLLPVFGDLEITVDFLNEIDKLIQLIESPIFAYLRLQLLDTAHNQDLVKSLYGVLMLLPQAEPFTLLQNRLNCVPHFHMAPITDRPESKASGSRPAMEVINFTDLLQHFVQVQKQHREFRRRQKLVAYSAK